MRNVFTLSTVFVLVTTAALGVASADESTGGPAASLSTAPGKAEAPETEMEFLHRLQMVTSFDGSDSGVGLTLALRYRWVEAMAGGDLSTEDARQYGGVKLRPLPDEVLSPYAYGHMGRWSHETGFLWNPSTDGGPSGASAAASTSASVAMCSASSSWASPNGAAPGRPRSMANPWRPVWVSDCISSCYFAEPRPRYRQLCGSSA